VESGVLPKAGTDISYGARLTRDQKKAARYALLASQYLEKAERITAETMMLPAE
jgi:hypothetical protein